jgi:hypothetical protein
MHQSEKLMTGSELDEKDKYVRVDHGKRITPPPEKQNSWRWSAADMILHQLLIIRSSPTKLPGTWRRRRERNNSYSRACTDWADLSCGINRPRWRRARAVSERPSERVLLELNGTRWNEPARKRVLWPLRSCVTLRGVTVARWCALSDLLRQLDYTYFWMPVKAIVSGDLHRHKSVDLHVVNL